MQLATDHIRSLLNHNKHSMYRLLLVAFIFSFTTYSCGNKAEVAPTPQVADAIEEVTQTPMEEKKSNKKSILFFGDSLTAGYMLEEEESFPSLVQDRIDSLGLPYEVINAGLSGETSAGGKGRIDWVLKQDVDIFVLELGANDVLRGLDLTETDKNLRAILDQVKSKDENTSIIIAGMQAPPNMGKEYTDKFVNIFSSIAKDYNAGLIPFLLEGVAGIPDLNLGDGKHPNAAGQKIVLENVWATLKGFI